MLLVSNQSYKKWNIYGKYYNSNERAIAILIRCWNIFVGTGKPQIFSVKYY